mgnify:CR=1 FL=1
MDISGLLGRLKDSGISVGVDGDHITLVPGTSVPPDVAKELREHKAEVLDYLKAEYAMATIPDDSDANLLAWANWLGEQELHLTEPVSFEETPLRTVTTCRISWYATSYLRDISRANVYRRTSCWGIFSPEWWAEREHQALMALAALREAMAAGR